MTIEIIKRYGTTDSEFSGDYNTEMYIDGKYVVGGDYYHDKISVLIQGWLDAFDHLSVAYDLVNTSKADMMEWD